MLVCVSFPSHLTLVGPVSLLSWVQHSQEQDPTGGAGNAVPQIPAKWSAHCARESAPLGFPDLGLHLRSSGSPFPGPLSSISIPFPLRGGPGLVSVSHTSLLSPRPSRLASELSPQAPLSIAADPSPSGIRVTPIRSPLPTNQAFELSLGLGCTLCAPCLHREELPQSPQVRVGPGLPPFTDVVGPSLQPPPGTGPE